MTDHVSGSAGAILGRIERSRGRPLRAMIEISDRCNEVCVHCYQEQGLKGEMSTEQVKRVMDELAELGVLVLTIWDDDERVYSALAAGAGGYLLKGDASAGRVAEAQADCAL